MNQLFLNPLVINGGLVAMGFIIGLLFSRWLTSQNRSYLIPLSDSEALALQDIRHVGCYNGRVYITQLDGSKKTVDDPRGVLWSAIRKRRIVA